MSRDSYDDLTCALPYNDMLPKPSRWYAKAFGIIYRPNEGQEPNSFQRLMHRLLLGVVWTCDPPERPLNAALNKLATRGHYIMAGVVIFLSPLAAFALAVYLGVWP